MRQQGRSEDGVKDAVLRLEPDGLARCRDRLARTMQASQGLRQIGVEMRDRRRAPRGFRKLLGRRLKLAEGAEHQAEGVESSRRVRLARQRRLNQTACAENVSGAMTLGRLRNQALDLGIDPRHPPRPPNSMVTLIRRFS